MIGLLESKNRGENSTQNRAVAIGQGDHVAEFRLQFLADRVDLGLWAQRLVTILQPFKDRIGGPIGADVLPLIVLEYLVLEQFIVCKLENTIGDGEPSPLVDTDVFRKQSVIDLPCCYFRVWPLLKWTI